MGRWQQHPGSRGPQRDSSSVEGRRAREKAPTLMASAVRAPWLVVVVASRSRSRMVAGWPLPRAARVRRGLLHAAGQP